jgi:deoxyribonuclease V
MNIIKLHEWKISPEQAKAVQKNLRAWIVIEDQFSRVKTIARVKTKSIKGEAMVKAHVSLISYPKLKIIEKHEASMEPDFHETEGLNTFREAQVVVKALQKLKREPDLILCDGQGIVDEESFGLASHIGLLSSKPSIGIRKPPKELSLVDSIRNERGAWLPLTSASGNLVIGSIVRVGCNVAPIEASPGHLINMESAVKYVLDCFPREINKTPQDSVAVDINLGKLGKKASA